MKYGVLLILSFLSFTSMANDSIAEQICNAYANKTDKDKCFSELQEEPRKIINPEPSSKYLSFKHGGTACADIMYWKRFLDNVEIGEYNMKAMDKHCFYIRENSVVYGFLSKITYKGSELVQVKSSDGQLLWIEFGGVAPIASSTDSKPNNWATRLRTVDDNIVNSTATISTKKNIGSVNSGVRTKGGGVACLSEKWYKDIISRVDVDFFNRYLKSKKCLILKEGMPITLLDTTVITRRSEFMFEGVRFWTSADNIITD